MNSDIHVLINMLHALESLCNTPAYNNKGEMIGTVNHVKDDNTLNENLRMSFIKKTMDKIERYIEEYQQLIRDSYKAPENYRDEILKLDLDKEETKRLCEEIQKEDRKLTDLSLSQVTKLLMNDYLLILSFSGIDPFFDYKLSV